MTSFPFPSETWVRLASESARRSTDLHRQVLQSRSAGLKGVQALIQLQIQAAAGAPRVPSPARAALFSSEQIDAFGTGRISDCLGPEYARYDSLKIPRIPNGDLKMMSRITAISGQRRSFAVPAQVTAEYDVPLDAWYLRDGASRSIPVSLLMEIALQPCGFLSAYLDTYSFIPNLETGRFYFRNLDGAVRVLSAVPGPGKGIATRARLLSSVVSGGTVIQKFAFELSSAGVPFAEGESIFGYFPAETMASQAGLDGGKTSLPAARQPGAPEPAWADLASLSTGAPGSPRLSGGRLRQLEAVSVSPAGGRHGRGYAYGFRKLDPGDWFYPFHFYGDPVMPGSLGVEAIYEVMQVLALASGLAEGLSAPRFTIPAAPAFGWRYRGQILRSNEWMEVEFHVTAVERSAGQVILTGDASLWADGLRIYELKNAALGLVESDL